MPLTRPLLHLVGAALVFSLGWGASGALHRAPPVPAVSPAAPEPATCADPLAMAANATLVGEVRDARHDLALASERLQASTRSAEALPGRLQSSPEDWARRTSDDSFTLRLPCARWDGARSFTAYGARRQTHSRRSNDDTSRRADFLGLEPGERETLTQVYTRTQARVWQSLRQVCESSDEYLKAVADETEPDDARRIAVCRGLLLDAGDPATRRAYREVAAVRARGRSDGAENLDRHAQGIFALTGAPELLFDEMKRAFGKDAATRLVDHGVTCFDESAYDLRPGEPGGRG